MCFFTGFFVHVPDDLVGADKRFYQSRPSTPLLLTTLARVVGVILLPYTPLAPLLGFVPLPRLFWLALGGILVFYLLITEIAKTIFYKNIKQ